MLFKIQLQIFLNPTFSSIITQQVSYQLLGDHYRISYRFGWQSGTSGSGEYLINLPSGLLFNTTYNSTYTGTLWNPNTPTMVLYLITTQGGIIQTSNWSSVAYIIPYNSTSFRLVLNNNNNTTTLTTWSSSWYVATDGILLLDFDIWQ